MQEVLSLFLVSYNKMKIYKMNFYISALSFELLFILLAVARFYFNKSILILQLFKFQFKIIGVLGFWGFGV